MTKTATIRTPCPNCDTTVLPEVESDEYDTCLTCSVCGYNTGWKYVFPDAYEAWDRAYDKGARN